MSGFPENVVEVLVEHLSPVDDVPVVEGVLGVLPRGLNATDPNGFVGITVVDWTPIDTEMGGGGGGEPALASHGFVIEHVVKHDSQIEGERIHREVAKSLRLMLYRDPAMQLALASLSHVNVKRERVMKWTVGKQRYANNEIDKKFWFASATEFAVLTETV